MTKMNRHGFFWLSKSFLGGQSVSSNIVLFAEDRDYSIKQLILLVTIDRDLLHDSACTGTIKISQDIYGRTCIKRPNNIF